MGNEEDYISDEALDRLSRLLLDRIDQDIDLEGKDEGIFLLSGLDGFFAAIVSGPEIIFPSQWLPSLWGDFEPEWESEKEAEETIALLIDIMNSIAGALLDAPEDFEPMFYESFHDGEDFISVEEWCVGYMRGVNLAASQWQEGGEEMMVLLETIKAFGELDSMVSLKDISEEEAGNIPSDMRDIHAFWLQRRSEYDPVAAPYVNESGHVGRNDPCPCGSGKKYKKCCLH